MQWIHFEDYKEIEKIAMEEIICYTVRLPEGIKQNIPFMELLYDERWAEGVRLK